MIQSRISLRSNGVLAVGIASISEKEESRLLNGSAKSQRNSREHVVELEVFHQLHCLVSAILNHLNLLLTDLILEEIIEETVVGVRRWQP